MSTIVKLIDGTEVAVELVPQAAGTRAMDCVGCVGQGEPRVCIQLGWECVQAENIHHVWAPVAAPSTTQPTA